jgi:ribose/xylose/arabinose/galactoside ABC-type transport system permease subunit
MPSEPPKEKASGSVLKNRVLQLTRNENFTLVVILIVLVAVFGALTDRLSLSRDNVLNIMLQSSMRGVAAVGQALVILTAGIDVSVGGISTLVVCIGGALITTMPGYLGPIPWGAGLVIMLLAGAGLGAINGLFVSRLRLAPLIVTLAMWQITRGAASIVSKEESMHIPDALAFVAHSSIGGVPIAAFIFVAAIVLGYLLLNHTTFGSSVYAVGGNEINAWLSGIKTRNTHFWVYVISGFCAAIAAVVQVSRVMSASPVIWGITGLELAIDTIAAVVIGGVSLFGGKGSIIGALFGVLIIGVLNNGMNIAKLGIFTQSLLKGGVILAAVGVDAWRRRSL